MTEKSILIAVNPPYAECLVYGVKTIEWRTKPLPTAKCLWNDIKAYVYETKKGGGSGTVIGEVKILGIYSFCETSDIPGTFIARGLVSREQLKKYQKGGMLYGAKMVAPEKYEVPRPLSDFGKVGFGRPVPLERPPQSWCYVEEL